MYQKRVPPTCHHDEGFSPRRDLLFVRNVTMFAKIRSLVGLKAFS
jgi:hypothetical protein